MPLFVPFAELVAAAQPPQWVIEDFAERDSLAVLFGESGSYKSFVALDWLLHVAAGKPWHGHAVQQGAAFYICGEGQRGMSRRLAAWQIRHRCADIPFFATQHEVFVDDPVAVEAASDQIAAICQSRGVAPVAIGVDTLARNMQGDESSTADMNRFVACASQYLRARFNAFVLVVHHPGHGDKARERGAYSLRGALDARYLVTRPEGTDLAVNLETLKMKDGEIPAPLSVHLARVELGMDDAAGDPVTSLVVDRVESATTVAHPRGKAKEYALRILEDLITRHGQMVAKVKPNRPVVTEELWRQECADKSLSASPDPASQERAFRRVRKDMLDRKQIAASHGYVWLSER